MTPKKSTLARHAPIAMACVLGAAGAFILSSARLSQPATHTAAPSAASAPAPLPPHRGFWETLQIVADEVEGYASLSEMAARADHVVVGTLSNFRLNRSIQGDSPENVVNMAAVDVHVTDVVRGPDPGKTLVLEFLLPGPKAKEQVDARVRQQATTVPRDPVLLFLRHKGGSEAGLYRVVNSLGLWVEDGEQHVRAPLAVGELGHGAVLPRRADPAELAQEMAGRPAHLRRPPRDRAPEPQQSPEPDHAPAEPTRAPYADELANVHSLEDLVALVEE